MRANELQAYLQVMLDLIVEKGIITIEEVHTRFGKALANALEEGRNLQPGIQLRVDEEGAHTEILPVNCAERIHVCKAVCCKLDFALSAEEVESGKVRWDLGRPYMIRRNSNGYCCHNSDGEHACLIYKDRPFSCQKYNCSQDERIWKDFDNMELNEEWIAEHIGNNNPKLHPRYQ